MTLMEKIPRSPIGKNHTLLLVFAGNAITKLRKIPKKPSPEHDS